MHISLYTEKTYERKLHETLKTLQSIVVVVVGVGGRKRTCKIRILKKEAGRYTHTYHLELQ